jgi:DNA repair protein RadC
MRVKDWPAGERPREKLLRHGPACLSDAELLSLWLGSGSPGRDAVALARELLGRFGSLRALLRASCEALCGERGVGQAKYAQLQAALELMRRQQLERLRLRPLLASPQAAREYLCGQLRDRDHEVFCCLYLDSRHRLLHYEELFRGTIDGASVYPREVVKRALESRAAALILAHNHPSGVAEPSGADERITQRLKEALALVDIRLLDHLIVGEGGCVSLAELGRL